MKSFHSKFECWDIDAKDARAVASVMFRTCNSRYIGANWKFQPHCEFITHGKFSLLHRFLNPLALVCPLAEVSSLCTWTRNLLYRVQTTCVGRSSNSHIAALIWSLYIVMHHTAYLISSHNFVTIPPYEISWLCVSQTGWLSLVLILNDCLLQFWMWTLGGPFCLEHPCLCRDAWRIVFLNNITGVMCASYGPGTNDAGLQIL